MPAGLQCWDASGKLIVDIGDYNTRLLDTLNITIGNGQQSISVNHSLATKDGTFGVIISTSKDSYNQGYQYSEAPFYVVRCLNGSINIITIGGAGQPRTKTDLVVKLYGFI